MADLSLFHNLIQGCGNIFSRLGVEERLLAKSFIQDAFSGELPNYKTYDRAILEPAPEDVPQLFEVTHGIKGEELAVEDDLEETGTGGSWLVHPKPLRPPGPPGPPTSENITEEAREDGELNGEGEEEVSEENIYYTESPVNVSEEASEDGELNDEVGAEGSEESVDPSEPSDNVTQGTRIVEEKNGEASGENLESPDNETDESLEVENILLKYKSCNQPVDIIQSAENVTKKLLIIEEKNGVAEVKDLEEYSENIIKKTLEREDKKEELGKGLKGRKTWIISQNYSGDTLACEEKSETDNNEMVKETDLTNISFEIVSFRNSEDELKAKSRWWRKRKSIDVFDNMEECISKDKKRPREDKEVELVVKQKTNNILESKSLQCDVVNDGSLCLFAATNYKELKSHATEEHSPMWHDCNLCDFGSLDYSKLKKHTISVHKAELKESVKKEKEKLKKKLKEMKEEKMKIGIRTYDDLDKVIDKVKAIKSKEVDKEVDIKEEQINKNNFEDRDVEKEKEKADKKAEETKSDKKAGKDVESKAMDLIKNIEELKGSLPKSVKTRVSKEAKEKATNKEKGGDEIEAKDDTGKRMGKKAYTDSEKVNEVGFENKFISMGNKKEQKKDNSNEESKADRKDEGKKESCSGKEAVIEAEKEDLIDLMNSTVKELKIGITDGLGKVTEIPKSESKWWRKRKSIDVFDLREENPSKKRQGRPSKARGEGDIALQEDEDATCELEPKYEELPNKEATSVPGEEKNLQSSTNVALNNGVKDSLVVLTDLKDSDEEDDLARSLEAEEFEEESIEDEEFEEDAIEMHLKKKLAARKMKAVHWKEKDMPKVKDMTKCDLFRTEEEQRKRNKRSTM